MAKKIKKTRKELLKEPDEFITISGKLIGFMVAYKNQLTYALGIIVALALIFSGYRFFSIRSGRAVYPKRARSAPWRRLRVSRPRCIIRRA